MKLTVHSIASLVVGQVSRHPSLLRLHLADPVQVPCDGGRVHTEVDGQRPRRRLRIRLDRRLQLLVVHQRLPTSTRLVVQVQVAGGEPLEPIPHRPLHSRVRSPGAVDVAGGFGGRMTQLELVQHNGTEAMLIHPRRGNLQRARIGTFKGKIGSEAMNSRDEK